MQNMKLIYLFIFTAFLFACNAEGNRANQTAQNTVANPDTVITNCYTYTSASDTILLNINQVKDSVTGTLVYKLKEKDSNHGTINGSMKDSILLADYTFVSEGVTSTRQVAFKKDHNNLVEGYGEVFNDNGKTSFKKPDSLIFSSSLVILKTNCE